MENITITKEEGAIRITMRFNGTSIDKHAIRGEMSGIIPVKDVSSVTNVQCQKLSDLTHQTLFVTSKKVFNLMVGERTLDELKDLAANPEQQIMPRSADAITKILLIGDASRGDYQEFLGGINTTLGTNFINHKNVQFMPKLLLDPRA